MRRVIKNMPWYADDDLNANETYDSPRQPSIHNCVVHNQEKSKKINKNK